jgi:hypothetical protein
LSRQITFSFLTSGPNYALHVPDGFAALPTLDSPLFNGIGGRSFTFIPAAEETSLDSDSTRLDDLVGGDGRTVEFYKRLEDPPLWWLRWPLTLGSVYSHLREEDGESFGPATASAISISEAASGLPFLSFAAPMKFGASAVPGFQETVRFGPADAKTARGLSLTRPGFLKRGEVRAHGRNNDNLSQVRAGLDDGIELSTWARDAPDAMQAAELALESLSRR